MLGTEGAVNTVPMKLGVITEPISVLLCTGFHARTYPTLDSVWRNPLLTAWCLTRWMTATAGH